MLVEITNNNSGKAQQQYVAGDKRTKLLQLIDFTVGKNNSVKTISNNNNNNNNNIKKILSEENDVGSSVVHASSSRLTDSDWLLSFVLYCLTLTPTCF